MSGDRFNRKVKVTFEAETNDIISMIPILDGNFKMKNFQYEVMEE